MFFWADDVRREAINRRNRGPGIERLEDRCLLSTASGAVTGMAFLDRNGDGALGANEAVVSGATVTLTGTTNQGTTVNASVVADGAGGFRFDNVLPGSYSVTAS